MTAQIIKFPSIKPVTPKAVLKGVREAKPLAIVCVYVDQSGEMQIAACENLNDDRVVSILARAQHRIQRLLDMVEDKS